MQVHLVDATYELFRAHYAPRPDVRGTNGTILSGVSGLCDQLLYLLREEGATHVGCATDRVIESFRNDLYPGYKSSAGMPPELLGQFPIAEAAIEALGIVLWPMVQWEADDAIAAAAGRFAGDTFYEAWDGKPMKEIWDIASGTMPEDNPGSLKQQEYGDILAYFLSLNEFKTGDTELQGNAAAMAAIKIEKKK